MRAIIACVAVCLLAACDGEQRGLPADSTSLAPARVPTDSTRVVPQLADTALRVDTSAGAVAPRSTGAPAEHARRGGPAASPPGSLAAPARTPQAPARAESVAPAPSSAAAAAPIAPPQVTHPQPVTAPDPAPPARPFGVGEKLSYEVKFGFLSVGRATMEVTGVETVRGIPAYHTRFEVDGGNRLYRVHDVYQSWIDTRSLASLRYWQDIDEGDYEPKRRYEIFPDRKVFTEQGNGEEQPSVGLPLDEGSFLYWLRTIPLEVGKTYTFNRYFRPDRNPVTIRVLRREQVKVPAGTFSAIVVQPVIKTKGLFSEGGRAEVWFADDSTRTVLQVKSRLSIGSLSLHLRDIQRAPGH